MQRGRGAVCRSGDRSSVPTRAGSAPARQSCAVHPARAALWPPTDCAGRGFSACRKPGRSARGSRGRRAAQDCGARARRPAAPACCDRGTIGHADSGPGCGCVRRVSTAGGAVPDRRWWRGDATPHLRRSWENGRSDCGTLRANCWRGSLRLNSKSHLMIDMSESSCCPESQLYLVKT